jgi:hypothetical protein
MKGWSDILRGMSSGASTGAEAPVNPTRGGRIALWPKNGGKREHSRIALRLIIARRLLAVRSPRGGSRGSGLRPVGRGWRFVVAVVGGGVAGAPEVRGSGAEGGPRPVPRQHGLAEDRTSARGVLKLVLPGRPGAPWVQRLLPGRCHDGRREAVRMRAGRLRRSS